LGDQRKNEEKAKEKREENGESESERHRERQRDRGGGQETEKADRRESASARMQGLRWRTGTREGTFDDEQKKMHRDRKKLKDEIAFAGIERRSVGAE